MQFEIGFVDAGQSLHALFSKTLLVFSGFQHDLQASVCTTPVCRRDGLGGS